MAKQRLNASQMINGLENYNNNLTSKTKPSEGLEPKAQPKPEVKNSIVSPAQPTTDTSSDNGQQTKRKPGRPKKEPTISKTIYFPKESIYQKVFDGPLKEWRGNLTDYLCHLIKEDLERNKDLYSRYN